MTGQTPTYEILAFRFGIQDDRLARQNFLFDDGHCAPDAVAPFDFYVWVIRNESHLVVVDTGFTAEAAARRGRTLLRPPVEGLAEIGVDPAAVSDVVITHMHWDHAGNLDLFPHARIHLQEDELAFCTGRAMRHDAPRRPFDAVDVVTAIRRLYDGNLLLHRGRVEVVPGVTVHPAAGHTPGLQVVRVPTKRGWVVLASDASHLWANIRQRSPFPILDHLASMVEAYETIEALADGDDHIIPGHDPQVALRFPPVDGAPGWVSLHEAPIIGSPVAAILNGAAK